MGTTRGLTALLSGPSTIKGRTIKKRMGGGGGGAEKKKKKIFAQGQIKWKTIHARQLTLKNIHAMP